MSERILKTVDVLCLLPVSSCKQRQDRPYSIMTINVRQASSLRPVAFGKERGGLRRSYKMQCSSSSSIWFQASKAC
eukprot:2816290-Rhodomonas_salina.1